MNEVEAVKQLIELWYPTKRKTEELFCKCLNLKKASDAFLNLDCKSARLGETEWHYSMHGSGVIVYKGGDKSKGGLDSDFDKPDPDSYRLRTMMINQFNDGQLKKKDYRNLLKLTQEQFDQIFEKSLIVYEESLTKRRLDEELEYNRNLQDQTYDRFYRRIDKLELNPKHRKRQSELESINVLLKNPLRDLLGNRLSISQYRPNVKRVLPNLESLRVLLSFCFDDNEQIQLISLAAVSNIDLSQIGNRTEYELIIKTELSKLVEAGTERVVAKAIHLRDRLED